MGVAIASPLAPLGVVSATPLETKGVARPPPNDYGHPKYIYNYVTISSLMMCPLMPSVEFLLVYMLVT